jgi:hypothetical protein
MLPVFRVTEQLVIHKFIDAWTMEEMEQLHPHFQNRVQTYVFTPHFFQWLTMFWASLYSNIYSMFILYMILQLTDCIFIPTPVTSRLMIWTTLKLCFAPACTVLVHLFRSHWLHHQCFKWKGTWKLKMLIYFVVLLLHLYCCCFMSDCTNSLCHFMMDMSD